MEITKKISPVIGKIFDNKMAGAERIELPSKVLETPMLPLYHAPKRVTNLDYNILSCLLLVIFNNFYLSNIKYYW